MTSFELARLVRTLEHLGGSATVRELKALGDDYPRDSQARSALEELVGRGLAEWCEKRPLAGGVPVKLCRLTSRAAAFAFEVESIRLVALAMGSSIPCRIEAARVHFVGGEVGKFVPLEVRYLDRPARRGEFSARALAESIRRRLQDLGYANVRIAPVDSFREVVR